MLLAFDDDGPGPVIVLLHGFPLDRTMWSNQRSSLGSIYRLIVPDLRGHGTTAAPEGIYTVDEMAGDVLELLDALQLFEPVIFCGLSMGGYLALSIVDRHPERVKALILSNSRDSADLPEAARIRCDTAAQIEESGDTELYLKGILPKLFAKTTFERNPDLVARTHSRMSRLPLRTITGTLRGLATRPDRTHVLPKLEMPVLVLAGTEDSIVPLSDTERMVSVLPDGKLVMIPDSGHLSPLENPSATDHAILDFLDRFH